MTALPNPFLNSTVSPRAVGSAVASSDLQPRATAETISNPVAKATKGKAGTAGVNGPVRRSTAGTGLRVGEASADLPATSEIMDATAGETALNFEPSMTNGGGQETPASAPTKNPDAGVLADRIDWHEFFDAVMDERIVLFELYDEVPLFIRTGDHLRRWEA